MLHSNSHFSTKIVRRYLYHNFKNPYTLTGCDATSKTGTKAAALKANYHLLASLGQNRRPISLALKQTEKYLWSAPYSKKNCHAFDDLRYVLYTKKNKTVWFLPPTSNMSHGHNLGWLYFDLICSNLISVPEINLNPVEFGWNPVDSVFLPNKCIVTLPKMYTVTFGCKKKCTARCQCSKSVSAHFMRRILQVHWRRMLYLSLPIDSVGHCIIYANIQVFSDLHFPYMDRIQGHIRENTYQRKPVYSFVRHHGDFAPFWKSLILGLLDGFVVCTKIFLEVIGPYKNVKQEFSLDSKVFTGLCYRAWTSI